MVVNRSNLHVGQTVLLAYEVGKLDFTDDTMLKIPLPVNYKEMSEETLKSFLESDGEYE
jgi:hypothetical protein